MSLSDAIPYVGPAMSVLGGIFGGGQQVPQTRVLSAGDQLASLPPYLQNLYQQSSQFLTSNLGKPFGYPGQLQVGMSPLSQAAYGDIGSLTGITPFAGGEMTADITGAYTDPTQNPVVQNMVAMLNNQYGPTSLNTQQALRTLHGNFNPMSASSGAQGYSGAASAEGALLGNLQAQLASQVAQLLQNVYTNERNIQTGETNQALNIPGIQNQIGLTPTTLQQQNITALQGDWLNQLKNMFGVPSAVFPSVAAAFSPQQQSIAYGSNPLAALGSGITSFVNSPTGQNLLSNLIPSPSSLVEPSPSINSAEAYPSQFATVPPVTYPDVPSIDPGALAGGIPGAY